MKCSETTYFVIGSLFIYTIKELAKFFFNDPAIKQQIESAGKLILFAWSLSRMYWTYDALQVASSPTTTPPVTPPDSPTGNQSSHRVRSSISFIASTKEQHHEGSHTLREVYSSPQMHFTSRGRLG